MSPSPRNSIRRDLWQALRSLAIGGRESTAILPLLESAPELTIESSIAQGLGPASANVMTSSGMPVPDHLRRQAEMARFARVASVNILSHVETALAAADIPWVALKGVIVGSRYENPELRVFNDVDLLVRGRDLGASLDALTGAGMDDINRNWANYLRYEVAETPMWAKGMAVDLHWHVIPMGRTRKRTSIDIEAMLERRRPVTVAGTRTWTLDREDLLIHVCVHAALSGATRVRWLLDVRALIQSEQPDWDELVSRARTTGLGPKIGQVLDRARQLVLAPVPTGVPVALCPSPLLAVRASSDHSGSGRGLPGRFVRGLPVEISGDSISATASALKKAIPNRIGHQRPRWNVGDPEGPLYWDRQSGGPNARAAYIDYAGSEASS